MITFYLVRHGTKEAIPFDPALTSIGIKQAEETAKHLKSIPFQAIIASPKKRTQQTAQIIAAELGLPLFTNDLLKERMEWENGEAFDEFLAEWNKTDLDRNYKPRHGKGSIENGIQMRQVLDELSKHYKEGNILLISHGGTIGDLLRAYFKKEDLVHVSEPTSHAKFIDLQECSITIVEKVNNTYKLVKVNDVSHLSIPLV